MKRILSLFNKWILWGICSIIVALILWNTYLFLQNIRQEERLKMEIWAAAYQTINNADPEITDIEFPSSIVIKNTSIPILLCNEKGEILSMANIDEKQYPTDEALAQLVAEFKAQNQPIEIDHPIEKQWIYYGNSSLITKMKYYPIALVIIFIAFIILVWSYFTTSKSSIENKLWAGMAKETAHQIGTPLSSLLGWVEIMKIGDPMSPEMIQEIEKDIIRLNTIADRFSKIGSQTDLECINVIETTKQTLEYIKARSSKKIDFSFKSDADIINLWLNPVLHSWTIENLVKNAVDAIDGAGKISVNIQFTDPIVRIFVSDTGKGIERSNFHKVFEPGYSTKKRGWGLGLSLTKRIVEIYHKGHIKVHSSEIGKGTTFVIKYKRK